MSSVVRVRNASDMALSLVQSRYPNYHPLLALADLAHKQEVVDDPKLEFEVHKAILPYVMPKLSSVEVKAEQDNQRRVIVTLFEDAQLPNGSIVDVEMPLVLEEGHELVRLH